MQPAVQELCLFDPAPLTEAFGEFGSDALEMLQLFVKTSQPLRDQLLAALSQDLLADARECAHALKGAANSTGAVRLGHLCAVIDGALKDKNAAQAKLWAADLDRVFTETVDAINGIND